MWAVAHTGESLNGLAGSRSDVTDPSTEQLEQGVGHLWSFVTMTICTAARGLDALRG